MNILALSYLFPNPNQADYGIFVYNRLNAVRKHCEVKVVVPLQWYPFRKVFRPALEGNASIACCERLGELEVYYPRFPVIPRYFKTLDAVSCFLAFRKIVSRIDRDGFEFDLIDVHWTYPDIFGAYLVARHYNKPFIVTIRGREALYLGEWSGRKLLLDWCLRKADGIVALSSELAGMVMDIGVPPEKVNVVLNGVDVENFSHLNMQAARKRLGLPFGPRILLSIGRLTEAKGHQHLIKAVHALSSEQDLELHIIGGVNPESDYSGNLNTQIEQYGLKNIIIHEVVPHDQLIHWYNAADVFCLASHSEGCPNVVIEALACGTPVVVTDVGAVPDLVMDGQDGMIVREMNDIDAKIAGALAKNWDRVAISRRTQAKTWEACAEDVIGVYKKVLDGFSSRNEGMQ